ncbi:reverse transcriptase domain-containing protein [Tanacetum coccineum]
MSVILADKSFQYPVGIAENMLVEVGKFTFPADFFILKIEEDNKVPLILGRPFLHTADAVIRVKQKQLNLEVGTERMIFNIDSAMKHSYSNDDTCFSIDVIDEILEEDFDALLDEGRKIIYYIEGTLLEEEIFSEFNEFMAMTTDDNSEFESDTEEPPFDKITINTDYKIKTSLEEPPTDLELKPLPDNLEYVFLEEPSFLPVIISSKLSAQNKSKLIQLLDDKKSVVQKQRRLNPNMQEVVKKEIVKLLDTGIIYPIVDSPWVSPIHCVLKKGGITIVTNKKDELVPTRTVMGWRVCIDYCKLNEAIAKDHFPFPFMDQMRMPLGLCNAPTTFQRCMLAIFHDMIEESVEVFMDDFSVFGDYFDKCLNNLDKMLQRCKDAQLVLNWEKCHFMVKEEIVLGHKLLEKDTPFEFNDECQKASKLLKEKRTCAPVIVRPNWNLPFELMCDASDFAVGVVLEIKDRKGTENVAADHLSRIENDESSDDSEVDDNFPGETLMEINTKDEPWFADFANYLVADIIPKGMTYQQKNKFFSNLKHYFWEEPHLFKVCSDGIIRRCVSGPETQTILDQCHHGPTDGHYGPNVTAKKVIDSEFYWSTIIKEAHTLLRLCETCQKTENISKRDEMPLNNIQVCEIFDIRAKALPTNAARVVITFLKKLFCLFRMPKALISDRDQDNQDCIVMSIWKDASYFGDAAPRSVADAQIQDKDGLQNENDATKKSHDDSILKIMYCNLKTSHASEDTHVEDQESLNGDIPQSYAELPRHKIHKDHPIEHVIGDEESKIVAKALRIHHSKAMQEELLQFKLQKVWILVDLHKETKQDFAQYNSRIVIDYDESLPHVAKLSNKNAPSLMLPILGFMATEMDVQQKKKGIFISQDKYVNEILRKYNYTDVKSASTPTDLEKPLVQDGDAADVDEHLYRSMIGSLMYLTASRPDIMFAVCACARFQVSPKTSHLLAVKRIFRYLKGKPSLGLWYSKDSPLELVAYTDSDYAGATQDRKSTTGGSLDTKPTAGLWVQFHEYCYLY